MGSGYCKWDQEWVLVIVNGTRNWVLVIVNGTRNEFWLL